MRAQENLTKGDTQQIHRLSRTKFPYEPETDVLFLPFRQKREK